MTTGRHPDDLEAREKTGETKRSLAVWLAVLALVLTILLIVFFTWWEREGDETDDEDVTRIELVRGASVSGDYLLSA